MFFSLKTDQKGFLQDAFSLKTQKKGLVHVMFGLDPEKKVLYMSCFSGNRKKVLYKRFFQVTELEPTGIFSLFDKCGLIGLQPRRGDTSVTPYERSVVWGSTPVGQPKPYASWLTA